MIKKNTQITIHVGLDENQVPEKISWNAQDREGNETACQAFLLSFWNNIRMETERIDLWVKDMPLDEMNFFFYQTLLSMADTYHRATSNEKLKKDIIEFALDFAKKTSLVTRRSSHE